MRLNNVIMLTEKYAIMISPRCILWMELLTVAQRGSAALLLLWHNINRQSRPKRHCEHILCPCALEIISHRHMIVNIAFMKVGVCIHYFIENAEEFRIQIWWSKLRKGDLTMFMETNCDVLAIYKLKNSRTYINVWVSMRQRFLYLASLGHLPLATKLIVSSNHQVLHLLNAVSQTQLKQAVQQRF